MPAFSVPDVPPGFSLTCMRAQTRTRTRTRDFFRTFFRGFPRYRLRIGYVFFPESFHESRPEIPAGFQDGFRRLTDGGYGPPDVFRRILTGKPATYMTVLSGPDHPEKSRQDFLKEYVIPFTRFFIVYHESVITFMRTLTNPLFLFIKKVPAGYA